MRNRVSARAIAFWALTIAVALVAGAAIGNNRAHVDVTMALQREAEVNLLQRLEVLSLLRLGDLPDAIQQLEGQSDHLVTVIAANPGSSRDALLMAKAYRMAVPPSASGADDLERVFAQLPVPSREQCVPALRRLIATTPAGIVIQ